MLTQNKQVNSLQYPFPAVPQSWSQEEKQFAQGLRRVFDILFSKKVSSVLLADGSVTSRILAKKAVALSNLIDGFGETLDISENESVESLEEAMLLAEEQLAGLADRIWNLEQSMIMPVRLGLLDVGRVGSFIIEAGISSLPGPSILGYGKLGNFMLFVEGEEE